MRGFWSGVLIGGGAVFLWQHFSGGTGRKAAA